jgi:hypothetical protein
MSLQAERNSPHVNHPRKPDTPGTDASPQGARRCDCPHIQDATRSPRLHPDPGCACLHARRCGASYRHLQARGKSLGTLLIRTIYGRAGLITVLTARYYATHGYLVVNQSCRGTSGSSGDFEPFRPDIDDGADTVAWLRTQAWFDGRFALWEPPIWGIPPGP